MLFCMWAVKTAVLGRACPARRACCSFCSTCAHMSCEVHTATCTYSACADSTQRGPRSVQALAPLWERSIRNLFLKTPRLMLQFAVFGSRTHARTHTRTRAHTHAPKQPPAVVTGPCNPPWDHVPALRKRECHCMMRASERACVRACVRA